MPNLPETPNVFDRLSAALKALRHPHSAGGSTVRVFSTMNDLQRALRDNTTAEPETSSLVMSGVRWLGNRLPEAPVTVQKPVDNDESEVIDNHPLVALLKRPNPYYSGSTLWKAFAFSWIIKGDVYFIKWRSNRGQVDQLWYEPHWNVKPRWLNDRQGNYILGDDDPNALITYYEVDRDGTKNRVEVADVIHFRDGIDPTNSRCGLSGIATILREILSDSQLADYAANLLGNNGVPPYVLSLDKDLQLKQEDVDQISDRLDRRTSGKNIGKALVITGAKVEKLGFSPEQMDLRVSRYLSEERFAAVTGIPSEVLQLGAGKEHSIYNNVSEARRDAAQGYLIPLWWHIAEELTVQLLPDSDSDESHFVEHDTSEVQALQEDEDAKHKRIGMDYQNGIITRGEARIELSYDADEKLDNVYFIRSGSSTLPADEDPNAESDNELTDPLLEVPTNGGRQLEA